MGNGLANKDKAPCGYLRAQMLMPRDHTAVRWCGLIAWGDGSGVVSDRQSAKLYLAIAKVCARLRALARESDQPGSCCSVQHYELR